MIRQIKNDAQMDETRLVKTQLQQQGGRQTHKKYSHLEFFLIILAYLTKLNQLGWGLSSIFGPSKHHLLVSK